MTESASRSAQVVIVGGGIIGCSIAWRLAQAGLRVIVLDRSEPGTEASSAAAGMLAPLGEMVTPDVFSDLCIASRQLYPAFAQEIAETSGQMVGYRDDGSLMVALDEKQVAELAELHRTKTAQGHAVQALSAGDVHSRGLGLASSVRSGLFIPGDHWVDNRRLTGALLMACRHAGVELEAGQAVRHFHTRSGRLESVVTEAGTRYAAETFVLAAGCWSGELARESGMDIPVVPCRGQMTEFEGYLPYVVRAGIHYVVPRPERRLVVGTTSEYAGFEKAVTAAGLLSILAGVTGFAPRAREFRFLRAWAGLRPDTADHLPIIGYGEIDNLIFATGHFRHGILLTPVTAQIVAEIVLKGATRRPIEAYRPTRFSSLSAGPAGGHGQSAGH